MGQLQGLHISALVYFRQPPADRSGMIPFPRSKTSLSNMADKIIGMREEKLLFDFKIHIKDDFLPCHKFIVALHSPYMKAMLTSDMTEVAKQETRLDHIDMDIVKIILAYMYTEDFSVHKDLQLMDVITAADYLHMKELKEMCLKEVPAILEVGNVLEWWKMCGKIDLDTTKEHCEELMATAFVEITTHREFLRLNHAEVTDYFNHVCGQNIERDDMLKAAMYWANHDATERLEYLDDLLQQIQLDKCSMQGIGIVMKSYAALLDQQPMLYKVLSSAMADLCDSSTSSGAVSSKPVKQHSQQQNKSVVVIVGGCAYGQVNRVCWKLNEKNKIEELCQIPADDLAEYHSVCKTPHGFVITGGKDSDLCLMFMAHTRSWIRMQNMRKTRHSHGSVCVKSILFVIGGRQDRQKTNSVEMIPIEGGCWQDGPNTLIAVDDPKVADIDESVYMLDEEAGQLLHLDVNRKIWNTLAPFPQISLGVSMVSAQNKLFLAGGSGRECAWYNTASNAWFMLQRPLQEHIYGALVHYDNTLLLLGGSTFLVGTKEVEEYDIEGDSWSMCHIRMPTDLKHHYALLLEM